MYGGMEMKDGEAADGAKPCYVDPFLRDILFLIASSVFF